MKIPSLAIENLKNLRGRNVDSLHTCPSEPFKNYQLKICHTDKCGRDAHTPSPQERQVTGHCLSVRCPDVSLGAVVTSDRDKFSYFSPI